jgi:hypothetical protein
MNTFFSCCAAYNYIAFVHKFSLYKITNKAVFDNERTELLLFAIRGEIILKVFYILFI